MKGFVDMRGEVDAVDAVSWTGQGANSARQHNAEVKSGIGLEEEG